ncbi:MAG: hypothetical protein M0R66_00425 [Candidatus Omnitrophica bacterium]|nr:hypothetical protein [Candidatus Omnitrophota bacterium]
MRGGRIRDYIGASRAIISEKRRADAATARDFGVRACEELWVFALHAEQFRCVHRVYRDQWAVFFLDLGVVTLDRQAPREHTRERVLGGRHYIGERRY